MSRPTARFSRAGLAAAALASTFAFLPAAQADGVVNVYSYRQPDLIKPVLDAFSAETGIETQVLFLDKGLEERIAAEGANSPADVILTVDIARLAAAKDKGITQPVDDAGINAALPAEYRDPEGHWYGVTKRGRVIYASKDRVTDTDISYADLADPKWKGKICIRSGQHDYNLALFSALIAHWGEAKTEEWMKGFKANLARKPDGNDRGQAKSIMAGECDLALGNTYYVGLMMTNEKEPEQKDWANAINVVFPSIDDSGTHVNIRHGHGQERAEPRQRVEADGIPGERGGPEDLRGGGLRVSGVPGCRAVRHREVLRRAERRHAAAGRNRRTPQGSLRDGRPRRPRRRPGELSTARQRSLA